VQEAVECHGPREGELVPHDRVEQAVDPIAPEPDGDVRQVVSRIPAIELVESVGARAEFAVSARE